MSGCENVRVVTDWNGALRASEGADSAPTGLGRHERVVRGGKGRERPRVDDEHERDQRRFSVCASVRRNRSGRRDA